MSWTGISDLEDTVEQVIGDIKLRYADCPITDEEAETQSAAAAHSFFCLERLGEQLSSLMTRDVFGIISEMQSRNYSKLDAVEDGNLEYLEYLREEGDSFRGIDNFVLRAIERNHLDMVEFLISLDGARHRYFNWVFRWACGGEAPEVLEILLEDLEGLNQNDIDCGFTMAIICNNSAAIECLLGLDIVSLEALNEASIKAGLDLDNFSYYKDMIEEAYGRAWFK